jgi:hypothetical protein
MTTAEDAELESMEQDMRERQIASDRFKNWFNRHAHTREFDLPEEHEVHKAIANCELWMRDYFKMEGRAEAASEVLDADSRWRKYDCMMGIGYWLSEYAEKLVAGKKAKVMRPEETQRYAEIFKEVLK